MIPALQTEPLWDSLESYLVNAKRAVTTEIRNYPQPIAGCDAQIPALWEQRDGLVAELETLARSRTKNSWDIGTFIAQSSFIDAAQKESFLASLAPGLRCAAE